MASRRPLSRPADGAARVTTAAFAELRNVIFATVAQRAIRLVSGDLFRHLHAMDLRFHLERQTGGLQRVMDRGSRSINFVLSSLVFNVVPTALEISLVSVILASHFGPIYAAVTLGTMGAYVGFTVSVTVSDLLRMIQACASRLRFDAHISATFLRASICPAVCRLGEMEFARN